MGKGAEEGFTQDDGMGEGIAEEILVDENELAEGYPGFSFGGFEV